MIKAILFDMDGVLIDAKDWHFEALNRSLMLFGYEISKSEHQSTFDGLPTKIKLDMLSQRAPLPTSLHPFINEMKQTYLYELVHTLCKPKFNHEYALSKLKKDGFRLAVASNSIRYTVELMMNKSNLAKYLDTQVSNEDVKLSKPHPDIYQLCMSRLGVEPGACLVVEDNPIGIQAARAAGAHILEVGSVVDVTYSSIKKRILEINGLAQ